MAANETRPWWMTAIALYCAAVLIVTLVSDLLLPAARGVEVWLGFEVKGIWARLTAPIHWAMFGVAAWAAWTDRRWIVPWAVAYVFYAALSHLIWSEASPDGRGWPIGLAQALGMSLVGVLLWRAARAERDRA